MPASDPSTATPLAATGPQERARNPAISWTGNRLAFSRTTEDVNVWRLQLDDSGSAAGQPKPVLRSTQQEEAPDYSPDGEQMVFESNRNGTDAIRVWVSAANGSDARLLCCSAFSGSPRWSPDGQRIVFDSYLDGHGDIFVIAANGGEPFQLTTHPADDQMPSWSRDGQWVYFASTRTGRYEVWKISARGGEAIQIRGTVVRLRWSRSTERICTTRRVTSLPTAFGGCLRMGETR